jgi:undecaprenyl-diphosphatase
MIEQLNYTLFHLINQYAGVNPLVDTLAKLAAKYMPLVVIVGMVVLWIKNGKRTRDIVLYGFYAAILGLLINYLIGFIYFHPRPFMVPTGTLLFPYSADSSFPSDHSTLIFSMAMILAYFKETRIAGLVFLVLGLIGGFARVFCGVHFPLDILGSLVVAAVCAVIIYQLRDVFTPLNEFIKGLYAKITGLTKKG